MKKYLLILLLLFTTNNIFAFGELYETAPGYGGDAKIIYGSIHHKGWRTYYKNIEAYNKTNRDLLFKVTYRICRVKLISSKNHLGKVCSEAVTVYKVVPANTYMREFLDYSNLDEQLPYLKPIGGLQWGFQIIEFDVEPI